MLQKEAKQMHLLKKKNVDKKIYKKSWKTNEINGRRAQEREAADAGSARGMTCGGRREKQGESS